MSAEVLFHTRYLRVYRWVSLAHEPQWQFRAWRELTGFQFRVWTPVYVIQVACGRSGF